MRRQTLYLIPAMLGALVMAVAIGYQPLRASRALAAPDWRTVTVQGLTLELPPDCSTPVLDPGDPWSATEFRSASLGALRIARERPQGELPPALRRWFELPGELDGPVTYPMHRQPAQACPVDVFGPAAHLVRRERQQMVAVCVFDLDGSRYWVQIRTPGAFPATLAGFHRVLLSMRGADGAGVDPRLAGELREVEQGLTPALVPGRGQGGIWLSLLPMGFILCAGVLIRLVAKLSGRAPRAQDRPDRFALAPVEVFLSCQLQRKYFDAAIGVTDDRLVLYTFGTPFMAVPLASLPGRVSTGSGWFAPPYLEIALDGREDFLKRRLLYGLWKGAGRLRIYTEDILRLRAELGA